MSRCTRGCIIWLLTVITGVLCGALDSPDLVWRDWLLVEDTAPPDPASGALLRRITPKSVFVAPNLSGCSEGYRQDAMGRCVKLVKVNQAAQLDFILKKLNSMYAPPPSKKDEKDAPGPFHVSLPLGGMVEKQQEVKTTTEPPTTTTNYKTETSTFSTLPLPTSTSIPSTTDRDISAVTELLNFSDSVSTLRYPHGIDDPIAFNKAEIPTEEPLMFDKGEVPTDDPMLFHKAEVTTEEPTLFNKAEVPTEETILFDKAEVFTKEPMVFNKAEVTTEDLMQFNNAEVPKAQHIQNKPETLANSDSEDSKRPFVIVVANSTYDHSQVSELLPPVEYNVSTTTENTQESTRWSGFTEENESFSTNDGSTVTTENPEDSRYESEIHTSTVPATPTTLEAVGEIEEQVFGETNGVRVNPNKPQANIPENIRSKCDLSVQVSQLRDGRIISQSSKLDCQPETTTVRTPVRTTNPVPVQSSNVRFPSASASTVHKTGYIRFPEGTSVTTYGTKLWNDDSSQPFWWPTAWNPFQSSFVRGWPLPDRNQASSTIYHKQYHQHPSPSWTNKHSQQSWPVRRIYQRD